MIALSVARSLGRHGIPVYLLDGPLSEARHSKFCTWIPRPYDLANAQHLWVSWLLGDASRTHKGAIVLPCSDEGLEVVLKHRAMLEQYYKVIEANDGVLRSMLDKAQTYELAAKLNVPAPRVWQVDTQADLLTHMDEFRYPCALKPRSSHDFVKRFPTLKMFIIDSPGQMISTFADVQRHNLQMLVTELIPQSPEGWASYYSYLDENGNPLFHFTKRKLRQFPNAFGLGTYHVTDWNPEVAEAGLRFFKAVGLRGIGNVEFMRDPRDGQLKLIECNARFTLTTELVAASGIDIALLAYNRLIGQPIPQVDSYRTGLYAIRPTSDFLAFRELNRQGKMTLGQWGKSIFHRQHFLVFHWNDPMPALVRLKPFLWKQVQKLGRVISFIQGKPSSSVHMMPGTPIKGGSLYT